MEIRNMVDVRKFLGRYGYFIYTGEPLGDLEMIKDEVKEMFQAHILDKEDYIRLMKVIAREEEALKKNR
ncbi:MAG: DUF910 family protein [Thermicanus sp.]|nr:DUF910 family protein [Thermicanus sp.]